MRYPEARISEVTGITDKRKIELIEHYMSAFYFYPYCLNSVTAAQFDEGALVSVKELEKLGWNFV